MKRANLLRQGGVTAVFIFDGGKMPGKAGEEADRKRCALVTCLPLFRLSGVHGLGGSLYLTTSSGSSLLPTPQHRVIGPSVDLPERSGAERSGASIPICLAACVTFHLVHSCPVWWWLKYWARERTGPERRLDTHPSGIYTASVLHPVLFTAVLLPRNTPPVRECVCDSKRTATSSVPSLTSRTMV
jgi:hypothetical protein